MNRYTVFVLFNFLKRNDLLKLAKASKQWRSYVFDYIDKETTGRLLPTKLEIIRCVRKKNITSINWLIKTFKERIDFSFDEDWCVRYCTRRSYEAVLDILLDHSSTHIYRDPEIESGIGNVIKRGSKNMLRICLKKKMCQIFPGCIQYIFHTYDNEKKKRQLLGVMYQEFPSFFNNFSINDKIQYLVILELYDPLKELLSRGGFSSKDLVFPIKLAYKKNNDAILDLFFSLDEYAECCTLVIHNMILDKVSLSKFEKAVEKSCIDNYTSIKPYIKHIDFPAQLYDYIRILVKHHKLYNTRKDKLSITELVSSYILCLLHDYYSINMISDKLLRMIEEEKEKFLLEDIFVSLYRLVSAKGVDEQNIRRLSNLFSQLSSVIRNDLVFRTLINMFGSENEFLNKFIMKLFADELIEPSIYRMSIYSEAVKKIINNFLRKR